MDAMDRLQYLLGKIRDVQASAEEYDELIALIDNDQTGNVLRQLDAFHETAGQNPAPYDAAVWKPILLEVLAAGKSIEGNTTEEEEMALQPERVRLFRRIIRPLTVAASIFLVCTGIYLFIVHKPTAKTSSTPVTNINSDIAPGGNKAVLTLANGAQIVLDSAANGILAQQGNAKVLKTNNGQLAYNILAEKPREILYNTLATPRGGQYQLVLPDGSKVWLNAASSIRYPTTFAGTERVVVITGEAYFEVAKNPAMPFTVKANGMEVNVLGTKFNINAYDNEPSLRTTLFEGSVKVSKNAASAILKPGQQAQLSNNQLSTINDPDIEQVIAWKNGLFLFNSADVSSVLRQVERWYNIDVVYEGTTPHDHFSGLVSRTSNLSEILKILEQADVHFRLEGKKLVVMP